MPTFFRSAMTAAAELLDDDGGVDSSFITAVEFDELTQTMTVSFRNGPPATYPGTTYGEYSALKNAGSVGSHYWNNVRIARGRSG